MIGITLQMTEEDLLFFKNEFGNRTGDDDHLIDEPVEEIMFRVLKYAKSEVKRWTHVSKSLKRVV